MKNSSRFKISIIMCMMLIMMFAMSSNVFAAFWWGDPGYNWALTSGLDNIKPKSQANQTMLLSDFYTLAINYLKLYKISPRNESIHHEDDMDGIDNVAKGIFDIINGYNSRESLTIQQYYIVENYIDHGRETLEKYIDYSQYMTRESLKNIDLYLALSKYRAATLIGSRSDREYILSKIGYVKNSEIIQYNMLPYASSLTRKEFLLVMYDLISPIEKDDDTIINDFYEADVLRGYGTGLELDKKITYAEAYSFLYRFGGFDFGTDDEADETESESTSTENATEIR